MSKTLPIKHLSARVPWHDNKWNGRTCCNVLDNSFCRILPKIDSTKQPDIEPSDKEITEDFFPPCISEKGTFLSPQSYVREIPHSWTKINKLYKHFRPCVFHHKPFSFNAIPFLWMMKSKADITASEKQRDPSNFPHRSLKAKEFELDYKTELEQEVDVKLGFEGNHWVQHEANQKVLLDAFFGCLKKQQSLIFFYCKHTPFSEPNERVIVGVAKVRNEIGSILHYNFDKETDNNHRSYPWDRCVEHTLTNKNPDGFLLPYHDILAHLKENKFDLDLDEYAAFAPDYSQFSFASELVEHDTAIDALLNMADSLKKAEILLEKKFSKELTWIDDEISKIWDMRGAFPGMGSVMSALKIEDGNTIAWEIEKIILQKDGDLLKTNPWEIFEESMVLPNKYVQEKGEKLFNATAQRIWKSKPAKTKEFLKLLSRCQLNNDQAKYIVNNYRTDIGATDEITNNLYLLYEKTRLKKDGVSFRQIDKLVLPPEKVREVFPLQEGIALTDNLDERRVRAFTISIMEEAASEGHSLLPFNDVMERLQAKAMDEPFPIDEDIFTAQSEDFFFKEEIESILPIKDNTTFFLKLTRLIELKSVICQRLNFELIKNKPLGIDKDWLAEVNNYFDIKFPILDKTSVDFENELLAREEKAEALRTLTNYKFSVLIGPAGSGKTSLLEIFEQLPEIKSGGFLKLAPTGKARVKLGHDAQTLAQFLYAHDRYDAQTGNYLLNENGAKFSGARNIIVDESSMLTEEQLASLFDALGPVDRIILVGDYRQLPPIGTGRPFVDIVAQLRPESSEAQKIISADAYAELRQIRRQAQQKDKRWDVALSKCFGDKPTKEDIDTFHSLASGEIETTHIHFEKWYESDDFRKKFQEILEAELNLDKNDISKSFDRTIGAIDSGAFQYFNVNQAEKVIENWQIISPVNGYGYGVKEVNKFIQTTYRKPAIDLALNINSSGQKSFFKRKVAKPKGSDNMVYGDKVINLKNTRWEDWQGIEPKEKRETALYYIANGEIGVITGKFRNKNWDAKGEPNVEISFSTQQGYSYVYWADQLKEDGKYPFELAYAITVHKSQGSGFKKVFFILPSKGSILSRELLYTALTRQEDKIIIMHQGDFRDFIRLASTDASSTARRFTDLFHLPEVRQLKQKWYDARYVNISERGEPMLSKNEVIIANCLHKYKKQISYAYEDKLKFDNTARTVKPDFTIENLGTGKKFYWEHLGMMTKTDYREKWEKKLAAYLHDGFVLHSKASTNDEKILILTEENPNGGINSQEIDALVRIYILEE
jgi:energy-coupling factor transporter ATP-binding protein EcfA2